MLSVDNIVGIRSSMDNYKFFFCINDKHHLGEDIVITLEMVVDYLGLVLQRAIEYEKIVNFAYFDFLTGIGNRHYFEKIIHQEIKRHQRLGSKFSFIMLDIDHFKEINDRFGHSPGDLILKQVADILKSSIREIDHVIRYGGEEFLILLPHTKKDQAYILAERLRKRIEGYNFKIDNRIIKVTVSMGVAEYDPTLGGDVFRAIKECR